MKNLLRVVAGTVVGYVVLVLILTLIQEVWLGGVEFGVSSPSVLLAAGVGSLLAAVVAGAVGAGIAAEASRWAGGAMSLLVVVETIALVHTGGTSGPLWFDVLAAGSLIVGILLGAALVDHRRRRVRRFATPGERT